MKNIDKNYTTVKYIDLHENCDYIIVNFNKGFYELEQINIHSQTNKCTLVRCNDGNLKWFFNDDEVYLVEKIIKRR